MHWLLFNLVYALPLAADGAEVPRSHPRHASVHDGGQVGGRPARTVAADRPRDDAEPRTQRHDPRPQDEHSTRPTRLGRCKCVARVRVIVARLCGVGWDVW